MAVLTASASALAPAPSPSDTPSDAGRSHCATGFEGRSFGRVRAAALATLVALLAACGGGGGGGASPGNPPPPPPAAPAFTATQLLPLAQGHRWVYQLQDAQGRPVDTLVTTVLAQTDVPGGPAWRVVTRSQTDAAQDDEEFFRVEADGIRSVPGPQADPLVAQLGSALVLRASFSPGDTWTALDRDLGQTVDVDGDGRLDRVRARAVVTVQPTATLSTPAGTVAGVAHLRTVTTLLVNPATGGAELSITVRSDDWYAPGLGPLRNLTVFDDPEFGTSLGSVALSWSVGAQRSDTQAPALTQASPADGSSSAFPALRYVFSETMDRQAMVEEGFSVLDGAGRPVLGSVLWSPEGTAFEFLPALGWSEGRYTVRFSAAAVDLAGNPLPTTTLAFNVDRSGPVLTRTSPLPGSATLGAGDAIELEFDEALGNLNPLFTLTRLDTGTEVPLTLSVQGRLLVLQPGTPLVPGAAYRLRSVVDLLDAQGNLAQAVQLDFSVRAQAFGASQALPGLQQVQAVQAADLDGDGRSDLLAIASRSDSSPQQLRLMWLRQAAGSGLSAPQDLPLPARCVPLAVDPGDLDADGLTDVLVSAFSTEAEVCGVAWLRQSSTGVFVFGGWLWQDSVPEVVRLLPLVGVSRPGVLLAGGTTLSVLRPEGATGFAAPQGLSRPLSSTVDVAVGDLDGDGRADLALLGVMPAGGPGWALVRQLADGRFVPLGEQQAIVEGCCTAGLVLGAAEAQGRREFFVIDGQRAQPQVQQLLPGTDGLWALARSLPVPPSPHAVATADINGDGRLDVVTAHANQGLLAVSLRRADGSWDTPLTYAVPVGGLPAQGLAVADFNGDGRPDIVLENALLLGSAEAVAAQRSPLAGRGPVALPQWLRSTQRSGPGWR